MESKKIIKIIVGVVVVAVIIALYASGMFRNETSQPASPEENGPMAEETPQESGPIEVTGGPEGSEEKPVLIYEIRIDDGKFVPENTKITKGGRVQIGMIAVDGDYDVSFSEPLENYLSIDEGKAAVFGFDATTEGIYEFGCRDRCPEGKTMTGTITVE